jgi:hypothetical protein
MEKYLTCNSCGYIDKGNYCSNCGSELNNGQRSPLRYNYAVLIPPTIQLLKFLRTLWFVLFQPIEYYRHYFTNRAAIIRMVSPFDILLKKLTPDPLTFLRPIRIFSYFLIILITFQLFCFTISTFLFSKSASIFQITNSPSFKIFSLFVNYFFPEKISTFIIEFGDVIWETITVPFQLFIFLLLLSPLWLALGKDKVKIRSVLDFFIINFSVTYPLVLLSNYIGVLYSFPIEIIMHLKTKHYLILMVFSHIIWAIYYYFCIPTIVFPKIFPVSIKRTIISLAINAIFIIVIYSLFTMFMSYVVKSTIKIYYP